ncbi:MAG TPA: hypothetical protein VFX68_06375 [Sulfuricurvum sp.]|nr:hypothetical protein [Sulfuricurvum sp.]
MMRNGYTRIGFILSLAAAFGLGYTAYVQYRIAQINSVITTTVTGAQKAARAAGKMKEDGNGTIKLAKVAELEAKGWVLSDDNQSYELKEEGKVHASMTLDHKTGKVVYKIDCGSFSDGLAQQECSDALDGTGKNYVDTNDVPW